MYFDVKYHSPLLLALLCTQYGCDKMLYAITIHVWAMKQILNKGDRWVGI